MRREDNNIFPSHFQNVDNNPIFRLGHCIVTFMEGEAKVSAIDNTTKEIFKFAQRLFCSNKAIPGLRKVRGRCKIYLCE